MGLIAELRRRNVFRVAAAYAVVLWLAVQITEAAVPALHLPEWVNSLVFLFALLGFPFACLLAWAYELTPQGIRRSSEVDAEQPAFRQAGRKLDFAIIGLLLVALAYFVWEARYAREAPSTEATRPTAAPASPADRSVAVLPFVNMSPDPEQEYFSDGLSEELLNLLARTPGLKVAARTSSFAFKGRNEDLRAIGDALGVSAVVEGSVRHSGGRVRVTAQLIDVADGFHLWSETYDRELSDIFALQDDIAAAIVGALRIQLGAGGAPKRGRPTENLAAYQLFLQAKSLSSMSIANAHLAVETLGVAVELDPQFAEAYQKLSELHYAIASLESGLYQRSMALAHDAAQRALALDPTLVPARAMAAATDLDHYAWVEEIRGFERAMRDAPEWTRAPLYLVWSYIEAGYLAEGLRTAEALIARDPLPSWNRARYGSALAANGQREQARAEWRLALAGGADEGASFLVPDRLAAGDLEGAIGVYEAIAVSSNLDPAFARPLLESAHDVAAYEAQLAASGLDVKALPVVFDPALVDLGLGRIDRAIDRILARFERGDTGVGDALLFVATALPDLGLVGHPRYLELARASGFIALWEERGAPDRCHKRDGDWICR